MKYVVPTLGILFCLASVLKADEKIYDAVQDSEVDEELPMINFGADPEIEVYADWEDLPTLIAKPLFLFDIDIESWAMVDQATLQLHVIANHHDPGPVRFFRAGDAWDEMTVVWDNRPAEDSSITVEVNAPEVIVNPVLWEIDVTEIVQAWVSGDPNHGFYLDVPDNNNWVGVDLATRENPDADIRPKLWINYWLDDVEEDAQSEATFSVSPVCAGHIAIDYAVPAARSVVLSIYDATGALVETLNPRSCNTSITWSGKPGVYFVRLATNQATFVEKAIIIK